MSEQSNYELWRLLDNTTFAISRLLEIEFSQFGLTVEQAATLDTIQRTGGSTTVNELVDITLRQHSSISIHIDRLAKLGLITKEKITNNKRFKILITDAGESLISKLTMYSIDPVFGMLTVIEKYQFTLYLTAIRERAQQLLGVPRVSPFIRRITGTLSEISRSPEKNDEEYPSNYKLFVSLNIAKYAVSRLHELELAQFNITIEQTSILNILMESQGFSTIKSLVNTTLRQQNTISIIANRMIDLGFLSKERIFPKSPFTISITEKGKKLFNDITTSAFDMTFSVLTDTEKKKLTIWLTSMLETARFLLSVPS